MKLHILKFLKILFLMLYIIITVSNFSIPIFAYDISTNFDGSGDQTLLSPIKTTMATILDVVRTVGMGIAIIILVVIAIKIMTAAPSEKANVKQYSIYYAIGAFIMIGASAILGIIQDFTNTAIN